jgi:Ala-tRNA(Pro) deacylase
MTDSVLQSIRDMLDTEGIAYRLIHHEPTRTSEDSARVRGESLRIGGKAILMKTDGTFRLFVISAELRIDSRAIKKHLNLSSLRFATGEELNELTGLVPGSVPPFGRPILPFDLLCDPSVFDNEKIAFNAGSLTDSIIMPAADYRRVAQPVVFPFHQ